MIDQQIPNLTDEEVTKAYIADPKNKETHIKIAQLLDNTFKSRWFSIREINTKTAVKNSEEAARMIIGLQLFGLCTSREIRGIAQFKITLTSEQKLRVLEIHKANHIKQIELIDKEIEKLRSEIEIEK